MLSGFSQCEDYVHGGGPNREFVEGSLRLSIVFPSLLTSMYVEYSFVGASFIPLLHELRVSLLSFVSQCSRSVHLSVSTIT